jgi:hypothetical protein
LNTLPELVTCTNPLLVLGLVCKRLWNLAPAHAPRGGQVRFPNALPNQFRCQTSKPCPYDGKRPALRLLKPARQSQSCDRLVRPASRSASPKQRMAAILKQQMRKFGGAERDRTVDPLLAKQVLSQLSYSPMSGQLRPRWWAWVDSNYRPHPYQGCALTN